MSELCEQCGRHQKSPGNRFCVRHCRKLLRRLDREGYLQKVPKRYRNLREDYGQELIPVVEGESDGARRNPQRRAPRIVIHV